MKTSFKCKTKDLATAIKLIKIKHPRAYTARTGNITLILKKDSIEISSSELTHTFKAKTKTQAILSIPRIYLESNLDACKEEEFACTVENGKFTVGGTTSLNNNIKVEPYKEDTNLNNYLNKPEENKEIMVKFNYTDRELLWITEKYKIDEILKYKLINQIGEAKKRKDENLKKVYELLKVYGVTKYDIEHLVESYIQTTEF